MIVLSPVAWAIRVNPKEVTCHVFRGNINDGKPTTSFVKQELVNGCLLIQKLQVVQALFPMHS